MAHDDPSHPHAALETDGRNSSGEEPPPFWEWVSAGIGLLLLAASIGYMLYDARTGEGTPPLPVVEVTGVEPQGQRFIVRFQVRNEGRATAAALRVAGELRRGDTLVENSEVEFDYLPGLSSRGAAMLFERDPRTLQLVLSPRSWREP